MITKAYASDVKRKCYKCERKLNFNEYILGNAHDNDKELKHLVALWNREEIEFYCCNCYRKEISGVEGSYLGFSPVAMRARPQARTRPLGLRLTLDRARTRRVGR